jgi:hypothetical protein
VYLKVISGCALVGKGMTATGGSTRLFTRTLTGNYPGMCWVLCSFSEARDHLDLHIVYAAPLALSLQEFRNR